MDLSQQILSGYCERALEPHFWAEPLNAITNASFIIAALVCILLAGRAGRLDGPVIWLIILMTSIGIGSFLFHSLATRWAAIADVLPIVLFILSYFTLSMRCYAGYGWGKSGLLTVGLLGALVVLSFVSNFLLRDLIGGSVSYVPALIALFVVGAWLNARSHPAGSWMMIVALIFVASLTARAVDQPWCDEIPNGTHWLWHILNGVVLGALTYTLIRHGRPQRLAGS